MPSVGRGRKPRGFLPRSSTIIGVVLLLVLPVQAIPEFTSGAPGAPVLSQAQSFATKINHIIIVMMENHAYDNYFGTYCQNLTKFCSMTGNGLPTGTCVPYDPSNLSLGCITPFPLTRQNWTITAPMPHSSNSSIFSWNNGSMNDFYLGEKSSNYPFGYYNKFTAPILWDLAEQYGLGDNFFSSTLSYSLPNHWHLVAGQAPPAIQSNLIGASKSYRLANRTVYLSQANATTSVEERLLNTSVSWNWYDHSIGTNYSAAIGNTTPGGSGGWAYAYYNPLAAKAKNYNATLSAHFLNNSRFFKDARKGTLPDVSWVVPPAADSDHPPSASNVAQGWVSSVVDAVESSPDWNTSAVFISWDEYGGFYDHVAPPLARGTNLTLGFRVPLLVISPYARENYIGHSLGYFESLLRTVENRFSLPCITAMDCNAPTLYQFFNFSQSPRAPMIFPTSDANAGYPIPLQPPGAVAGPMPPFYPPVQYTYFPNGEGPDVD